MTKNEIEDRERLLATRKKLDDRKEEKKKLAMRRQTTEIERFHKVVSALIETEPSSSLRLQYQAIANTLAWTLGDSDTLLKGLELPWEDTRLK